MSMLIGAIFVLRLMFVDTLLSCEGVIIFSLPVNEEHRVVVMHQGNNGVIEVPSHMKLLRP